MSTGVEALFKGAASNTGAGGSSPTSPLPVVNDVQFRDLPIDLLVDMEQPFRLYTEAEMDAMRRNISAHGVLQRLIVRPWTDGKYQIISGRNRRTGARLAGYATAPCEIRNLDDYEAELQMIATNLNQRPDLLPSEKAWAYRKQLEIMSKQGKRTDLTGGQTGHKSRDNLTDESGRTVQRYIRLTYLLPELLDAVDNKALGFGAGVTLSYLSTENQLVVHQYFFVSHPCALSETVAECLREAGALEELTEPAIQSLLSPDVSKPKPIKSISFRPLKKYFPGGVSKTAIEKTTAAALKAYFAAGNQIIQD